MDGRIVTVGGKRWRLRYVALRSIDGDCDPPDAPAKQIRIANRTRRHPLSHCETLVHEILHAADWNRTEESVGQMAADIARILQQEGCLREA